MRRTGRKRRPNQPPANRRPEPIARKKQRKLPFNPHSEATGRFIVSVFRRDMRQAGRDIVDIIGEILDKR